MGPQGGPIPARSTWRLMFRLARRDMRSHRVRTVLTVLMIALPVLVVSAGMTLAATYDVNAQEAIPRDFGSSQALLSFAESGSGKAIKQSYGQLTSEDLKTAAKRLPGQQPGKQPPAAAVQAVTGGTVLARSAEGVRVASGARIGHWSGRAKPGDQRHDVARVGTLAHCR